MPTHCFGCLSRTVRRIGSATLWIGRWIRTFNNMFSLYVLVRLWLYQVRNLSHDNFAVTTCTLEPFTHKNEMMQSTKLMLANMSDQRILPVIFNCFNRVLSWSKKLIKQTNWKWFSPNRTRKNSTNQTNQKRLIPVEHGLNSGFCGWLKILGPLHSDSF